MTDDVADAWERILGRLRAAVDGEFEILREIGSGGMAAVYLAREIALNRQVAIKVMSPALLTGQGMVERFRQEARTIAALDHRNIITIYAVRGSHDLHYFVMKFVKGRSLEHIIRTAGPLPIPLVRGLLFMIGDALGHAHRRGVIHRDVKPANILVDGDGNAVVTDFGIAKVAQAQGQTHSAVVIGTPAYMSPEQCYAQPASAASDQYSLGVVAYEMLTGRPPFSGSVFVVMEAHTKLQPPPIADLRRDCPPELEAAIMRMLAKDPSERWPSVHHALAELGAATLLDGHPARVALAKLGIPEPEERLERDSAPKPYVSSLAILAPPDWIESGDSLTLRASARSWSGDTMPGIPIRWESSASEVAGVNPTTGEVTAVSPGIVSITASFEEIRSSVSLQVVPRRVAALTVSIPPGTIHVGDRVQLITRLEDKTQKELKRSVAWQMTDATIASISESGVLRAIAPGIGLAFAEADGTRGSVEIRIAPARVAEVRPTSAPASLVVGDRVALGATAVDAQNNVLDDRALMWTTNESRVATISSDGVVKALAPGDVEFTCLCEGKATTIGMRVEGPEVGNELPTSSSSLAADTNADAGDRETVLDGVLVARTDAKESHADEVSPDPQLQPLLDGSSRDPVSRGPARRRRGFLAVGGIVVAMVAAIAVLFQREPNAAPLPVASPTPAAPPPSPQPEIAQKGVPATIEILREPDSLLVGDTTRLEAIVRDSLDNTLPDSVRWSTSRRAVASVDSASGLVRARDDGTVTITAVSGEAHASATFRVRGGSSRPSAEIAAKTNAAKNRPSKANDVSAEADAESDHETEHEFDTAIRNALWRRDTLAVRAAFQADLAEEIVAALRRIPANHVGVRRRGFVADLAASRVAFMMEVYETSSRGERLIIPYANLIAKAEKSGNQVKLSNIRRR